MKTEKRTIELPAKGNVRAWLEIELRTRQAQAEQRTIDLESPPAIYWELSVCGAIDEKNGRGRWQEVSGGQNIEEIAEIYADDPQVQKVAELWREWHLNDLNAGTRTQAAFIEKHKGDYPEWRYDYSEACDILKAADLYTDRGYKYGHAWLLKVMPYDVKKEILDIIQGK